MTQKILVVDDSRTVRTVVEWVFHGSPYDVTTASTASEAALAMRTAPPTLALIDYSLPDQSGFEFVQELRRDPAFDDVRLVILGGTWGGFDESRVQSCGADDFIMKPFKTDALIEKVAAVIAREKARPVAYTPGPVDRVGESAPYGATFPDEPAGYGMDLVEADEAPGLDPYAQPEPPYRGDSGSYGGRIVPIADDVLEEAAEVDEGADEELLELDESGSRSRSVSISVETVDDEYFVSDDEELEVEEGDYYAEQTELPPPPPEEAGPATVEPEPATVEPEPATVEPERPRFERLGGHAEPAHRATHPTPTPVAPYLEPVVGTPAPQHEEAPVAHEAAAPGSGRVRGAEPDTVEVEPVRAPAATPPAAVVDEELVRQVIREMLPPIVKEVLASLLRESVGARVESYATGKIDRFVAHELPALAEEAIEKRLASLTE